MNKGQIPLGLVFIIFGMIVGFIFIPKFSFGEPMLDQFLTPAFGALIGAAIGYAISHRIGFG